MTLDDLENEANGVLGRALGPMRRLLEVAYQRGRDDGRDEVASIAREMLPDWSVPDLDAAIRAHGAEAQR